MNTRYEHLAALIFEHRPSSIIEIGVHKGMRAIYMLREALRYQEKVSYIGFDVFETMGADFQELVLNGKGMAMEVQARRALHEVVLSNPGRVNYEIIVGKTQDTLHEGKGLTADFVFIDGDHRSEAIEADYNAVKASRVVVFDDYYRPDPFGKTPDLNRYGANSVCDRIPSAKVLDHGDQCRHGGLSHIVVVVNG